MFLSYSHHDSDIVQMLADLLTAADRPYFLDRFSIEPGDKWQVVIDDAIETATKVFVFWCFHAADSREVAREYTLAIKMGKKVVPVLLDDQDLPDILGRYRWIDGRKTIVHPHKPVGRSDTDEGSEVSRSNSYALFPLFGLFGFLSDSTLLQILAGVAIAAFLSLTLYSVVRGRRERREIEERLHPLAMSMLKEVFDGD
ncbi:MAG TPA: toll/interleukin-1 receptor domain-containing protein [Phycisphaerae bacterium]|nr:toll/interleukin-1 receptor domain-containing protein [Phycisphaerae bacterium]HQL73662.1 toll/interleukin-1 receptor domain-containing protein [Phycisphaerae bacterium]